MESGNSRGWIYSVFCILMEKKVTNRSLFCFILLIFFIFVSTNVGFNNKKADGLLLYDDGGGNDSDNGE